MRAAQDRDGTSGNVSLRTGAISMALKFDAYFIDFAHDYAKPIPQRGAESLEFRLGPSGQYCPHRNESGCAADRRQRQLLVYHCSSYRRGLTVHGKREDRK